MVRDGAPVSRVDSFLAGGGPLSRAFYYVVRALVSTFTQLYTRMSITGREHLPRHSVSLPMNRNRRRVRHEEIGVSMYERCTGAST